MKDIVGDTGSGDKDKKSKQPKITASLDRPLMLKAKAGQAWFPPDHSGICKPTLDPFNFCSESAWVYLFSPFQTHAKLMGHRIPKDFQCIHCESQGNHTHR